MKFLKDIEVQSGLKDSSGAIGSAGQVLSSTGSLTSWIDISIPSGTYLPLSAGPSYPLTGRLHAQDDIYISGEHVIKNIDTNLYLDSASGYNVLLRPGGSEKVRIQANGNFGIGTTSPLAKLQVNSITASTMSQVAGEAHIVGVNHDLSDTQMGTLNLTSTSRDAGTSNQAFGSSLTFSQNASKYVDGFEVVIGGIKTELMYTGNMNKSSIMRFYTHTNSSLTPKMSIDADGNVGIGETSPAYPLEVDGIIKTSTSFLGTTAIIQKVTALNANGIQFTNNGGSEKMRITDAGNVGIGTTSPGGKLEVDGQYGGLKIGDPSIGTQITYYDTTRILMNSADIKFYTNSLTERMTIESNGYVGIGTTSPAEKLDVSGRVLANAFRTDVNTGDYSVISRSSVGNAPLYVQSADSGTNQPIAKFFYGNAAPNQGSIVLNVAKDSTYFSNTNVGIGTTSPTAKLHVLGTSSDNATTKAEMLSNSVFSVRPHSTNSGTLAIAQVDSGNSVGMQFTNSAGTANWDISMQPFGGNVGIGTTSPGTKLQVGTGSGATVDTAYQIVADGSAISGIQILSGTNHSGRLVFGDSDNNDIGIIKYDHSDNSLQTIVNASEKTRVTSTGILMVGGTTGGYAGTKIHVGNFTDTQNGINILTSTTGYGYLLFGDGTGADTYRGQITYYHGDDSMLFNTNGSEKLRIVSGGGISFAGATNFGSAGQVLKSNGSASPAWVDASTVIGGPYLPLTAGSSYPLTGDLYITKNSPVLTITDTLASDLKLEIKQSGSTSNFISRGGTSSKGQFIFRITDGSTVTNALLINQQANVGIGTNSPEARLDVDGTSLFRRDLTIYHKGNNSASSHELRFKGTNSSGVDKVHASLESSPYTTDTNAGTLLFKTANASNQILDTRMVIDGIGNVGIGTTSPETNLMIYDTVDEDPAAPGSPTTGMFSLNTGGQATLSMGVGSNNAFWMSNVNRAFAGPYYYNILLNPLGGNVGIGTTSPGYTLDVNGSLHSTNITIADAIYHEGDTNTYIGFAGNDHWRVTTNNINTLEVTDSEVLVNNSYFKIQNSGDRLMNVDTVNGTFFLGDVDGLSDENYITSENGRIDLVSGGGETLSCTTAGKVGIGDINPSTKLSVNGGVQIANESATASAALVGTIRYRSTTNTSFVDMCMQTGATTYAWVNIVSNFW